jgi:FAD/FMN-containing dehydrogenase
LHSTSLLSLSPLRVHQGRQLTHVKQGEHGIGLGKKEYLVKELGLDTIGVMKSIKGALDPYWLMNPGKIIDTPS